MLPNNTVGSKLMKKVLSFFQNNNTGVCPNAGKSFGEVIDNFVVGGNETSLIAGAYGQLRILSATEKNNNENRVSDFFGSISMY